MRHAPRALLAGGLGLAVSFLVACGGGANLLTGGESSNLNSQLDAVSSAVGNGQCGAAATAVAGFNSAVANLHATVSPTLRRNLLQGASTVGQLSAKDCHTTTSTTTSTSSSTSPSTSSTTTSTSSSTTIPSSTTQSSSSTSATTTSNPSSSSTTTGSGGAGLGGGSGG